jgi:hypothetical protein
MADLEFKHHVSEIPQGQALPKPYQRQAGAEISNVPDIQTATRNYAASTNWMSSIGSYVAAKSSEAIATKLGTELGKNPQGDLGIPLTEFDAAMHKSYQTQSHAILGLQANKLITDANIELAKAPRLSPGMIEKANQSISIGLKNIFDHAPAEVKTQLEYQYGNLQISQFSDMNMRMIREQREDQRDNLTASNKQNAKAIYELARSGNMKAAQSLVDSNAKANDSGYATRITSKEAADAAKETAIKTASLGNTIREYDQADNKEEWVKNYAKNKPKDMSYEVYESNIAGLLSHIGEQDRLMSQYQNLQMLQAKSLIDSNPLTTTWEDLAPKLEDLTRAQQEQVHLYYIDKLRSASSRQGGANLVAANYSDARTVARGTAEQVNDAFDMVVAQTQQASPNTPLGQIEAQVAAAFGGPVPRYIKTLEANLRGTDPQKYQEAGAAIEYVNSQHKGENLEGLSKEAISNWYRYKNNLNKYPTPQEAALATHEQSANVNKQQQEANEAAWKDFTAYKNTKGVPIDQHIMSMMSVPRGLIRNPQLMTADVGMTFQTNFFGQNGDTSIAKEQTQDMFNNTYGQTWVNGIKEVAKYPIERTLGLPDDSAAMIHHNLEQQLQEPLAHSKKMFDEGKSPYYYELMPRVSLEQAKEAQDNINKLGVAGRILHSDEYVKNAKILSEANSGKPPKIFKRYSNGEVKEFDVVLEAHPTLSQTKQHTILGGWNVNLVDKNGQPDVLDIHNPNVGQISFIPDHKEIAKNYFYFHPLNAFGESVKMGGRMSLELARKIYSDEKRLDITNKVLRNTGHYIGEARELMTGNERGKELIRSVIGK